MTGHRATICHIGRPWRELEGETVDELVFNTVRNCFNHLSIARRKKLSFALELHPLLVAGDGVLDGVVGLPDFRLAFLLRGLLVPKDRVLVLTVVI